MVCDPLWRVWPATCAGCIAFIGLRTFRLFILWRFIIIHRLAIIIHLILPAFNLTLHHICLTFSILPLFVFTAFTLSILLVVALLGVLSLVTTYHLYLFIGYFCLFCFRVL